MRLVSVGYILILCTGLLGCADHHPTYVVCNAYCTPPMGHDEAVQAAQLKNAWTDDTLYVRPGR
jgi:hypothetical protein